VLKIKAALNVIAVCNLALFEVFLDSGLLQKRGLHRRCQAVLVGIGVVWVVPRLYSSKLVKRRGRGRVVAANSGSGIWQNIYRPSLGRGNPVDSPA